MKKEWKKPEVVNLLVTETADDGVDEQCFWPHPSCPPCPDDSSATSVPATPLKPPHINWPWGK